MEHGNYSLHSTGLRLPPDFEIWLRPTLILSENAWLTDGVPNVLGGVEFRALCRPMTFFQNKLGKSFLYGPGFVHSHCHVETGRGQTQTIDTKLEALYCLKDHCIL